MKRVIFAAIFGLVASGAYAAGIVLPNVTIIAPSSVSVACVEVGGAGSIHAGAPGTPIFNCAVTPSTWTAGTAVVANSKLTTTNFSGNTFDVVIGSTAITPGTIIPGSVTVTP